MTPNSDEIEELVGIAAAENDAAASMRLFRALSDVELFFPMESKQDAGEARKTTPLLRLPDGMHAMMLYTSKSHPDLTDHFGGGRLKDVCAAALKMPALDWVIVCNGASAWVSIAKNQIAAVLDDRKHMSAKGSPVAPPESGPTDQILEELITRAVRTGVERVSPPIPSLLPGRELFLELNGEKSSESDRAVMKTFSVQHLTNVIHAYLTRSRPGITYGGVTWEALKQMVANEPQIDGVQLINDADDWVVFDRESLGVY